MGKMHKKGRQAAPKSSGYVVGSGASGKAIKVVAVLGCAALLIFLHRIMLTMGVETLAKLILITQFLLVVMGVLTVVLDPWVKKHPILVVLAFVVLGAIAMFGSVRLGQENAKEAKEAQRKLIGLTTGG